MDDPLLQLDAWQQRCRQHGMGITAPRRAILVAMLELERATDAVIVLQRARLHCASTSLDTVYRFLRELHRAGLVEALPMHRTYWRLPALDSGPVDRP